MATISDVAKRAGVAKETVSRVLNNRGYISDKTKKKVYDAIEELHYRPNEFARGLSKGDMDTIAVIVPHIVHPFFSEAIACAEHEITKRQYKMLLYNSAGDEKKERHMVELCQTSFITGVLLFSSDIRSEYLHKLSIPVAAIERNVIGATTCILCDNAQGGRLAARELIRCGCRNVAAFGDMQDSEMPGDERIVAFSNECSKTPGVLCSIYRSNNAQYMAMEYEESIAKILDSNPGLEGLFVTSDLIGAQALRVCASKGIRVPEDLQIVSFDDVAPARYVYPSLTTIRQPINDMVCKGIDSIVDASQKKQVSPLVTYPVQLIRRESTLPCTESTEVRQDA